MRNSKFVAGHSALVLFALAFLVLVVEALKLTVGAAWATPESNVGCINPIAWPIANESGRKEKSKFISQVIHVLLKISF
ncbi:hypothetical protein E1A91_D04G074500v1 [Gossypium mustelinum]|uniref:Uncharacterized protein n=2 Tax=Gossypium TaxID=3633 RepID=A0A5J5RT64_GOSBA|nr:hypothetical protein ES319_D04G073200v1 [Gossypium barbadense]TYI86583.1 hypothetical protein E1A91_D04G074500v1 [Gossypium mustelinum]